jgi:hypothetical protein
MALRTAKLNEDAVEPVWGQGFGAAAELPLGAELYVRTGSTGDLVAGTRTDRVFDRAMPQQSSKENVTVFAKLHTWAARSEMREGADRRIRPHSPYRSC